MITLDRTGIYSDPVPWPRAVARLNKRYTNRFIEPVVSRLSGFAVVAHRGRRSGAEYRTPLYAFEADQGLIIALTYGTSADWAQNVLAGGGTVSQRGSVRVVERTTVIDRSAAWHYLPLVVRIVLRMLRVNDFMRLEFRAETGERLRL